MKGIDSTEYSSIVMSIRAQTANMAEPLGQVMPPSVTIDIIRMPKWTGSMPMLLMIGTKIGVSSSTMTVLSSASPAISRNTRMTSTIMLGSVMPASIQPARFCGTWR